MAAAENEARTSLGTEAFERLGIDSKLIATRPAPPAVDPVTVPIYHTSIYRAFSVTQQGDIDGRGGYFYRRCANPTNRAVELTIAELEGARDTAVFASGMGAVSATLLSLLKSGDHIVCQRPCYGGTQAMVENKLPHWGVEYSWVQAGSPVEQFEKLIRPNTKVVYGETPCNPDISILDLERFGALGTKYKVRTVVDSTFGTPFLQQPLKYGVDIVLHSCSKFMGGHSDVLGGCASTNDDDLIKRLRDSQESFGAVMSPFDASLLARGLRTLPLRMRQHCDNAMQLAEMLEAHPKVARVSYPGLRSHPGHDVAKRQMARFGGMIAFELHTVADAIKVAEKVKLVTLCVSLGGIESNIDYFARMTRGPEITEGDRKAGTPTSDRMLRFSVGLENAEDIKADMKQALDQL